MVSASRSGQTRREHLQSVTGSPTGGRTVTGTRPSADSRYSPDTGSVFHQHDGTTTGHYSYVITKDGNETVALTGTGSVAFRGGNATTVINDAVSDGTSVLLTDGKYRIENPGIKPTSNTRLVGASWNSTLYLKDNVNSNLLHSYGEDNIVYENLHLFGNTNYDVHGKAGEKESPGWGIVLQDCTNSHVHNCLIEKTKVHGITIKSGSENAIVTDTLVLDSAGDGINTNTNTNRVTFANNIVRNHGDTGLIAHTGARNVRIVGNHASGGASPGIWLDKASDCIVANNTVSGNGWFYDIDGIRISDGSLRAGTDDYGPATRNIIVGNRIKNNGGDKDKASYGIGEHGREGDPNVDYNLITNNLLSGNTEGAIHTEGENTVTEINLIVE